MSNRHFRPWLFILPGIIMGFIVLAIPVAQALRNSLFRIRLYRLDQQVFVNWENYQRLWGDPIFLMSVRTTVLFTVGCTLLSVLLGLAIAGVLATSGIRGTVGARLLIAFYLVPFVTTPVVVGMLGRLFMWEPEYGLVNFLLSGIGIDGANWLIDRNTALLAAVITNAWRLTPLALLIFYAALATIPDAYIESARVDGASGLTILTRIKIPLIRFHISFVGLVMLTSAFREFDVIYSLTGGGPGRATEVLSMLVYNRGVVNSNLGVASAVSFSMFVVVAIVALIYIAVARLGNLGR